MFILPNSSCLKLVLGFLDLNTRKYHGYLLHQNHIGSALDVMFFFNDMSPKLRRSYKNGTYFNVFNRVKVIY